MKSKNLFYLLLYSVIIIFLFIKLFELKEINDVNNVNDLNKVNENFSIQKKENKNNSYLNKHIIINFNEKDFSKILYKNNYLKTMNKINMKMRGFKNREKMYDFYFNNSFLNITKTEEKVFRFMIIKLLEKIENKILYNFIKNYLTNITIVKARSEVESGMPHTHSKTIVFPENYFNSIVSKYNLNLVNSILENEGLTFVHELLHIHQRYNKEKYNKMFNEWGFFKSKYINNVISFNEKNRHNPDGLKVDWIWKNSNKYYLIGALFNSNSNDLIDTDYVAKEIKKVDYNVFSYNNENTIKLNNFENFIYFFGINNNHYHPNEIASQYFEYYININVLKNYIKIKNKGYLIFKKNILNILK